MTSAGPKSGAIHNENLFPTASPISYRREQSSSLSSLDPIRAQCGAWNPSRAGIARARFSHDPAIGSMLQAR